MYAVSDIVPVILLAAHHLESEVYASRSGRAPQARNDAIWNTHKVLEISARQLTMVSGEFAESGKAGLFTAAISKRVHQL